MARRLEWSAAPAESAFKLPTFSAYPQEYMTNAGEYLLSLPQHLEAIAEAAEEEKDAATVAATAAVVAAAAGDDQAATVAVANNPPALDDIEPELEAGEWMSKVAEAASGLLLTEVRAIPALTEPGACPPAHNLAITLNPKPSS